MPACKAGAKKTSLHASPLTLAPGVPTDVEIRIEFDPVPTQQNVFAILIYEDDNVGDAKLVDPVRVTVTPPLDPNNPFASAKFQIQCEDLETGGKFDLVGPNDRSNNEVTQHIYAYGGGAPTSANVEVTCAIPTIGVQDEPIDEAVEGDAYCLYKLDRVEPKGHASERYINNKVCVRCLSGETHCPVKAVLDRGDGEKWHVTRENEKCTSCPTGVGVAPRQKKR